MGRARVAERSRERARAHDRSRPRWRTRWPGQCSTLRGCCSRYTPGYSRSAIAREARASSLYISLSTLFNRILARLSQSQDALSVYLKPRGRPIRIAPLTLYPRPRCGSRESAGFFRLHPVPTPRRTRTPDGRARALDLSRGKYWPRVALADSAEMYNILGRNGRSFRARAV